MKRGVATLIEANPLITHHHRLPNSQVIELLKQSHIGILPSWGETYGYFLLEAMACGCPVMAPNASPFTEFVRPDHGWLLDLPGERNERFSSAITAEESETLIDSIVAAVSEAVEDREGFASKSSQAVQFIRRFHDPCAAAERLHQIYCASI